ncbi:MAG: iron-sulfur cluster repair di-iron protein [Pirellulaceae bacterium]
MNTLQLAETVVGKIVAKHPKVARVFEKHQIDYCCRGGTTLVEACKLQEVDVELVAAEIEQVQNSSEPSDETNWNEAPLTELANHIVATHHAFLTTELPRISGLTEKVFNAHGDKRPELAKVKETFKLMREELESHMAKEENILFPAIKTLEANGGPQSFPFGSVTNPIGMMEHEHDDAGNALRRLRELTEDYTPPADACPTYRVMLESLENLEQDLHLHIHKENNILFPRAQELERSASAV